MPRRPRPVPLYKKHPTKNEARCYVGGRWVSLGPYGSDASRREYERVCAAVRLAAPAVVPDPKRRARISEVIVAFAAHAEQHYRKPSGALTGEVKEYRSALAPLMDLHGHTPAEEFGPLALQAYRQHLIDKLGWCRNRINKQVGRVRRVFRWAAGQEMVPASVHQALACVAGLQRGRSAAKETEKVQPVSREHVELTLPWLNRHQRCMVRLQLVTGMRPGEVCAMRLGEIDRTGDVWVWDLKAVGTDHKMSYADRDRIIYFGPQAQAVIKDFLAGELNGVPVPESEPLFSPIRARKERFAEMRRKRKSKVPPSQQNREVASPKRYPLPYYTATTLTHALNDAATKAGVPLWGANRLRHTYATEVRKRFGLEAVQSLLGHARLSTSEVYAEKSTRLALTVAGAMG